MILNKNVMETDSFLDVNNDIYHMITIFNNCQELKKLLVYTDKKPLERKEDVNKDLRDTQISRVPLLPYDISRRISEDRHFTSKYCNRYIYPRKPMDYK